MKLPDATPPSRETCAAERHVPDLLQRFLLRLETAESSLEVWRLIVALGRELQLPFVDLISASSWRDWKKTRFIRTSYDASWLSAHNSDPELARWSYFRSHAMDHLTPIAVGLEFLDEYKPLPEARVEVLRDAARRGMRAGYSVPLRYNAPPQAALITFGGDHSRRDMLTIINAHGWTLTTAALTGFQRYMYHFGREFPERNRITPKQLELLELIGAGLQDKQIADRLRVSVSAVRQRLSALSQNTGMTSRAELAALAMSLGVLPDPLNRPGDAEAQILVEMDEGGAVLRPTVVL
ncbi:autoinducer binding domain-containing protein [Salipiger sp. P9]|uniref:helix-turn-helix transcriptional regulator n=1 Tax=Salipiger pentaromativorans TaxID=2943193 RepID=UPI0021580D9A|nr:autoinducer binding domain-containing protein [Salipiger pentaromativorans]MCR8549406.1 autoinducer binding domain-containing protein [Salipiger pentaromativorans]